jgi:hypothetical protein
MDTLRVHWPGLMSGKPGGDNYTADRILTVYWPLITAKSIVLVSASECRPYDYSVPSFTSRVPPRYVGDAPIVIKNVAPQDGLVQVVINVAWDHPLEVITDLVVIDAPAVVSDHADGTVDTADLPQAVSAAVSKLPAAAQKKLRVALAREGGAKMKVRTAVRKARRAR